MAISSHCMYKHSRAFKSSHSDFLFVHTRHCHHHCRKTLKQIPYSRHLTDLLALKIWRINDVLRKTQEVHTTVQERSNTCKEQKLGAYTTTIAVIDRVGGKKCNLIDRLFRTSTVRK